MSASDQPIVMRLAQRIQFIEHGGRQTWETCMQSARDRAIEQAKACLKEMDVMRRGCFLSEDNSEPPQLWVWRGAPGDESAEPWQRVTGVDELRCEQCGYSEEDAATHLDHHLCNGEIPSA